MGIFKDLSLIGVFAEGLLSFFSPCVLPLIPLYMAYLLNAAKEVKPDGTVTYRRISLFIITLLFVLGIATTYFLMGLSLNFLKTFIQDYKLVIGLSGGIILLILALNQMGFLEIKALNREKRFSIPFDVRKLNYFKAYLLGFIFSFAWTPCVGPLLANVLVMAAGAEVLKGNLLILAYCLGFVIPFIFLGLFSGYLLNLLHKYQNALLKLAKVAAVIILLFGIKMVYDNAEAIVNIQKDYTALLEGTNDPADKQKNSFLEFSFSDQFGNIQRFSAYKGKYIIVNFISTWCPHCLREIEAFEAFNDPEVVKFYMMSDAINLSGNGQSIAEFLEEYDLTIPLLNDKDSKLFHYIGIQAFPTLLYLGPDGSVIGLKQGALNQDGFKELTAVAKKMYQEAEH